jgi:hypothetical protein
MAERVRGKSIIRPFMAPLLRDQGLGIRLGIRD